jgi:outer membrane receptor protein involved in Fe transport
MPPSTRVSARAVACVRRCLRLASIPLLLLALAVLATSAGAQEAAEEEMTDVFGGLGTTTAVDEEAEAREGEGSIAGRVFDGETGSPVKGATVILQWPEPAGGGEPRQEIATTDFDGAYEFPSVPPGSYDLAFVKAGYRNSTMAGFPVRPGEVNRADFPLPPLPAAASEEILQLDEFVVEASTVGEILASLELRLEADALLNIMSAEELSKFAAGDVAEALKRVAGVNVVEGQFAIIRGLEDRYSSTLFNGAPIPSPDPERQSVQLDLFPSDVVSELLVTKNFETRNPGNSAGGTINVVTESYPEGIEIKVSGGAGFEENALDRFLELERNSPVGLETRGDDAIETDFGVAVGGRQELLDRELRFQLLGAREIDFSTEKGFQEDREPRLRNTSFGEAPVEGIDEIQSGGLALGELALSGGRYDLTNSERSEQWTGYGGLGYDLDAAGKHRIDAKAFYTRKKEEEVQLVDDGYLPGFDYGEIRMLDEDFDEIRQVTFANFATEGSVLAGNVARDRFNSALDGHQWWTSLFQSRSFLRERELLVTQVNGAHELLEGLSLDWAWNRAETSQDEEAVGAAFFYDPVDRNQTRPETFPVDASELGEGRWATNGPLVSSSTEIDETQDFGRLDGRYELDPLDFLHLELGSGGWYERSERDIESRFLERPSVGDCRQNPACIGRGSSFAIVGDTRQEAGRNIFSALAPGEDSLFNGDRDTDSTAEREIWAVALDGKATLWDDLDLWGGLRIESIQIATDVDALVRPLLPRFGIPRDDPDTADIFPTRYVFFDRLDNDSTRTEGSSLPPFTNDQILGLDLQPNAPCPTPDDPDRTCVDYGVDDYDALLGADIDELRYLPALGVTYRATDELTLRLAYSQTVARPSFRELGYYVTIPPDSNDLELGNPQLQLSEVESFDGRIEYVWGDRGDLVAASGFYKTIQRPIEQIVLRDPSNVDEGFEALFRTWFNNPNDATLWGVEVEFRKHLGFLDFFGRPFLEYFTVGGNFTWIEAEVGRTEAELRRSENFFGTLPGEEARYGGLAEKRRLFGQPQWIANADLSFDHPDWGTRLTLAFFAISDILDAAGSATLEGNGNVTRFTIDRYVDSFHQLDLIFSQRIWGGLSFKASLKNLTDSQRGIIYDPEQTRGTVYERRYRVGRDYSFALSYAHSF